MPMHKYAKLKTAPSPQTQSAKRGWGRDRSSDRYDELKNSPEGILKSKKLAPRQKLVALVAHYEKPGTAPPSKKIIKQLKKTDFSGVDAKGINLRALGERAVGAINWVGADLSGQNFEGFKMPKVNMRGATLVHTRFDGGDLQNANLENARTGATSFVNADMRGANTNAMTGVVAVSNAALQGQKGIENLAGSSGHAHTDDPVQRPVVKGDPARSVNPMPRRAPNLQMALTPH